LHPAESVIPYGSDWRALLVAAEQLVAASMADK